MMIMIRTTVNTSHIYQNTMENNSRVSKHVLLFKLYCTRYISVIKAQNLCHLHQNIIITNDKVGWYALHIIFQNSLQPS